LRASFGVSSNEVMPRCKFALLLSESPLSHNHGHPGTVSHYGRPLAYM